MAEDLFDPHWYRIADLHPRLQPHVRVQRQVMRGEPWYVLHDPLGGRQFRLNFGAYRFVGLCDGRRSAQAIWGQLNDTLAEAAPTQGEVIRIVGQLADAGLLRTELQPDVEAMFEGQVRRTRKQTLGQLNPLSLRVPLFDPTPLLRPLEPLLPRLFSRGALLLWLLLLALAGLGAAIEGPRLMEEMADLTSSNRVLLLLWLAYPLVKLAHEFTHALAIRRWGGEVTRMGITLLVLTPVPWVDARDASTFPERHQRFLVSASGIMAELFLAALAFLVWRGSQPGPVHDFSLVVMLIGGVSTVLFNGNPLLRFDGYHMLCDAIGMPNLAQRSGAFWAYLGKRFLLRLSPTPPVTSRRERRWLLFYGAASYLYRIFISLLILYWLLGLSRILFSIALLFILWSLVIKPSGAMLRVIWSAEGDASQRRRARQLGLAWLTVAALLVGAFPLPHSIVADGVVWLPENAHVRAETEGFVLQVHRRDGDQVKAGELIMTLEDPLLEAEREKLQGQKDALMAKRFSILIHAAGDAKSLADELASLEERLLRNAERIAQQRIRAGVTGTLVLPLEQDLPGRFAKRGDNLGYILPADSVQVRAALPQTDAELARQRARAAQVWMIEQQTSLAANIRDKGLAAVSTRLPSVVLGDRGGGHIATDAEDPDGLTAAEPVLIIDLDVPAQTLARVGAPARVRMDLGSEPLLSQLWLRLRQVFLAPAVV